MWLNILLLLVYQIVVSHAEDPPLPADRINSYLIDNVENTDPQANIDAASKWLGSTKVQLLGLFKLGEKKTLQQFTNLDKIVRQGVKCNRISYEILRDIDQSIALRKRSPNPKEVPLRRIDNVVYQVSLQHAHDCLIDTNKYSDAFMARYNQMDSTLVERAESVDVDLPHPVQSLQYDYLHSEGWDSKYSKIDLTRPAYKALVLLMEKDEAAEEDRKYLKKIVNERTGKHEIQQDKFKSLFDKYLGQPCEYYTSELVQLFLPALFDAWFLSSIDSSKLIRRYELGEDQDFFNSLRTFRVCRELIDKKNMADNVIQYANNPLLHG